MNNFSTTQNEVVNKLDAQLVEAVIQRDFKRAGEIQDLYSLL